MGVFRVLGYGSYGHGHGGLGSGGWAPGQSVEHACHSLSCHSTGVALGVGHEGSRCTPTPSPFHLGTVTSALPRGASGYPGGLGLCDARACHHLCSRQLLLSVGGGVQTPHQRQGLSGLRVLLQCPRSSVLRQAELLLLLE